MMFCVLRLKSPCPVSLRNFSGHPRYGGISFLQRVGLSGFLGVIHYGESVDSNGQIHQGSSMAREGMGILFEVVGRKVQGSVYPLDVRMIIPSGMARRTEYWKQ